MVEVLPLSRVVIDLGLREGIQEGMTFGVLPHGQSDPEKGFKAQLIALVAGQAQTTAEILSLESPGQPVRVGDRLRILKEGTPIRLVSDHKKELTLGRVKVEVTLDNSTGLASPLSARRIARAGRRGRSGLYHAHGQSGGAGPPKGHDRAERGGPDPLQPGRPGPGKSWSPWRS